MVNDYRQVISAMKGTPWLITQDSLETILEIVNLRLSGKAFSDEEIRIRLQEAEADERDNPRIQKGGGVGVLSLYGPMFPKANLMTELSGATSLESFSNDLRQLVEDDSVKQIVLDIDSPGGAADMVSETGQNIKEASEIKPVYAVANTVAASGALWLASQATRFYCTPSGRVGSLGVYHVHEDYSKADADQGVKVTLVYAGKYKTAGNPHEPLSADAKEYIQEHVDEIYDDFVAAVADGRGISTDKVKADFGEGKMLNPKSAMKVGMIDDVVTLDDLLHTLVEDNYESPANSLSHAVAVMHDNGGDLLTATQENKSRIRSILRLDKGGKMGEETEKGHQDVPASDDLPEPARAEGDEGGEGGSRRDTPPPEPRSLIQAIALKLGLPNDISEKDLLAKVTEINAEVTPLREAAANANKSREFAAMFPEQAERMAKLEKREREDNAKAFAARFERLSRTDGDKKVKTPIGFSARTMTAIEEMHLSIQCREIGVDHLENLLDSIAEGGLVDYSEHGSARFIEKASATSSDPGRVFSQCVAEIMTQDNLDYAKAIPLAAERYPEEYAAYRNHVKPAEVEGGAQ